MNELGKRDCDMIERNNDNFPEWKLNEGDGLDDDFVPDDAWPVCPKCLTPCPPLQYYCPYCNSNEAINPLTPYIAFLNIRFNYDIFCTMWRKIWYDEHTMMISRIFYLLMITLFVPYFIIIGIPFLLLDKNFHSRLTNTTLLLFCFLVFVVLAIFVYYGFIGLMLLGRISRCV